MRRINYWIKSEAPRPELERGASMEIEENDVGVIFSLILEVDQLGDYSRFSLLLKPGRVRVGATP